jgi:hypothetical protein
VRRFFCALAAVAVLAPAGLRLASAAAGSDWVAVRCAMACGHAVKAGAVCCPMSEAGGVSMTTCPTGDAPSAAPLSAGHLAILTSVPPLAAPEQATARGTLTSVFPRDGLAAPPDHVPILLS